MGAVCGAIDTVVAAFCYDLGEHYRHTLSDAGFGPETEPPTGHVPSAVFGWNVSPWRSARKPPEYAVDDRAVMLRTPASPPVLRLDRQQPHQDATSRFAQIAPALAVLQKATLNQ